MKSTQASRAADILRRWAFNRKNKTCGCGGKKEAYRVTCPRCWFAAPQELRDAWQQAVLSKDEVLRQEVAAKLHASAQGRKTQNPV